MAKSRNRESTLFSGLDFTHTENTTPSSKPQTEEKEKKCRYNVYLPESIYNQAKGIAFIERKSVSEIVTQLLCSYVSEHHAELEEYSKISFGPSKK